jgi:C1A family cysteine protease
MLILLLLLFASSVANAALCDDPDFIPTFPPGNRFHGWDCNQIVRSMGSNLLHPQCSERIPDSTLVIQDEFDWRSEVPACVAPIRDQGECGSCWAFASVRSLAHRFCLLTPDLPRTNYVFSPQYLIDCDHSCYDNDPNTCQMGCAGGYLDLVWRYLRDNGTVLDSCKPYTAVDGTCTAATACDKYRSLDRYTVRTVINIQREIQQYGPVMAGLMIYSDFLGYTSGIYHKQEGTFIRCYVCFLLLFKK